MKPNEGKTTEQTNPSLEDLIEALPDDSDQPEPAQAEPKAEADEKQPDENQKDEAGKTAEVEPKDERKDEQKPEAGAQPDDQVEQKPHNWNAGLMKTQQDLSEFRRQTSAEISEIKSMVESLIKVSAKPADKQQKAVEEAADDLGLTEEQLEEIKDDPFKASEAIATLVPKLVKRVGDLQQQLASVQNIKQEIHAEIAPLTANQALDQARRAFGVQYPDVDFDKAVSLAQPRVVEFHKKFPNASDEQLDYIAAESITQAAEFLKSQPKADAAAGDETPANDTKAKADTQPKAPTGKTKIAGSSGGSKPVGSPLGNAKPSTMDDALRIMAENGALDALQLSTE